VCVCVCVSGDDVMQCVRCIWTTEQATVDRNTASYLHNSDSDIDMAS